MFTGNVEVNLGCLLLQWSGDVKFTMDSPAFHSSFSLSSYQLPTNNQACEVLRLELCESFI